MPTPGQHIAGVRFRAESLARLAHSASVKDWTEDQQLALVEALDELDDVRDRLLSQVRPELHPYLPPH